VYLPTAALVGSVRFGFSTSNTPDDFSLMGPHVAMIASQPNDLEGTEPVHEYIYGNISSGEGEQLFTSIAKYKKIDLLGFFASNDVLYFTKNNEVIHIQESPCKGNSNCQLYPWVSSSDRYPPLNFYIRSTSRP
jgi:hypothetical protein